MPAMKATSGVTWATVMVMGISLGRVDGLQNAVIVPNSSFAGHSAWKTRATRL
jgi:hypothetical protein